MTRKYFVWCIILLHSLVSSCAKTTQHDATLQSPSQWESVLQQYPRSKFIIAVGEGKTLAISQQHALLNLGQTFSVQVSGIQHSDSSVTSSTNQGKEQVTVRRSLDTNIRRQTNQLIQGAEVYPAGKKEHTFRSIAVLEKQKGLRILTQQVEDIDTEIQQSLHQAEQLGARRIETAAWLIQAHNLANIRAQRTKQIVVLGGVIPPELATALQIQNKIQHHFTQLVFTFQFAPTISEREQLLLIDSLALGGLQSTKTNSNADYTLTMQLEKQPPFLHQKWYWQIAQLTMQLSHKDESFGHITWDFKVAATREEQLSSRLREQITNEISQHITTRLIKLAQGKNTQ